MDNYTYELRAMLRVVSERLQQATQYKGDDSEEWADKETDLYWVKRANELIYGEKGSGDGEGRDGQ